MKENGIFDLYHANDNQGRENANDGANMASLEGDSDDVINTPCSQLVMRMKDLHKNDALVLHLTELVFS